MFITLQSAYFRTGREVNYLQACLYTTHVGWLPFSGRYCNYVDVGDRPPHRPYLTRVNYMLCTKTA